MLARRALWCCLVRAARPSGRPCAPPPGGTSFGWPSWEARARPRSRRSSCGSRRRSRQATAEQASRCSGSWADSQPNRTDAKNAGKRKRGEGTRGLGPRRGREGREGRGAGPERGGRVGDVAAMAGCGGRSRAWEMTGAWNKGMRQALGRKRLDRREVRLSEMRLGAFSTMRVSRPLDPSPPRFPPLPPPLPCPLIRSMDRLGWRGIRWAAIRGQSCRLRGRARVTTARTAPGLPPPEAPRLWGRRLCRCRRFVLAVSFRRSGGFPPMGRAKLPRRFVLRLVSFLRLRTRSVRRRTSGRRRPFRCCWRRCGRGSWAPRAGGCRRGRGGSFRTRTPCAPRCGSARGLRCWRTRARASPPSRRRDPRAPAWWPRSSAARGERGAMSSPASSSRPPAAAGPREGTPRRAFRATSRASSRDARASRASQPGPAEPPEPPAAAELLSAVASRGPFDEPFPEDAPQRHGRQGRRSRRQGRGRGRQRRGRGRQRRGRGQAPWTRPTALPFVASGEATNGSAPLPRTTRALRPRRHARRLLPNGQAIRTTNSTSPRGRCDARERPRHPSHRSPRSLLSPSRWETRTTSGW